VKPARTARLAAALHGLALTGSLLVAGTLLAGCASLREVSTQDFPLPADSSPTVQGATGTLSAPRTQSLLMRKWKNSFADTQAMAAVEELATSQPLIAGNSVTLLYDGPQTIAAMAQAISAATSHINLETYIFDADEVGNPLADLLIARQQDGVAVHVIVDAVGTLNTPQTFFDRLRAAGVQVVVFNPINPFLAQGPWEINQRDHRKLLVVDGAVAFAGGVNISSGYSNSSLFRARNKAPAVVGWRDTHVQIQGPAVAAMQWSFLEHWVSQTATPLADSDFFPAAKPAGKSLVRVLATTPDGGQEIYRAYVLAIQAARHSVHITSAYFLPDRSLVAALLEAAARGVDVRILLPSVNESPLVFYAGQSLYQELLQGGVRLYQLRVAVLHAKTAVIDGLWSTVGSANLDLRSFLHNHELNVVVYDEAIGQAMEAAFAEDQMAAAEITLAQWQQRPLMDRLKQWLASQWAYWL
jgi:cardiolipin synthase